MTMQEVARFYKSPARFQKMYKCTSLQSLGKDDNSEVFKATRKADGASVVMKLLRKSSISSWSNGKGRKLPKQIQVLIRCQGIPNVIRLHNYTAYALSNGDTYFYVTMEFLPNCAQLGQLIAEKGCLTEEQSRRVFRPLIASLEQMHAAGFLHGDVRAENVLVNKRTFDIRLVDFSRATALHEADDTTSPGTLLTSPPEYFLLGRCSGKCAEVWTVGVLLYNMIVGHPPFLLVEEIAANKRPHFPSGVSEQCKALIRSCLNPCASERPTLSQVLSHQWMKARV